MSPRRRWQHVPGEPYTATQAVEHLQCSRRWVKRLAETGRFPGAVKVSSEWVIPAESSSGGCPPSGSISACGRDDTTAAAERLGMSMHTVRRLVGGGEFAGAFKQQGCWHIPTSTIQARTEETLAT